MNGNERAVNLAALAALSLVAAGCAGIAAKPDPAIEARAAAMSLGEAREAVQAATERSTQAMREYAQTKRVVLNVFTFGPEAITRTQTVNGRQSAVTCRYDELHPIVRRRKVSRYFFAHLGCRDELHDASVLAVDLEDATRAAAALLRWRNSTPEERRAFLEKDEREFAAALETYRAAAVKPELPEEARRFKVQAEGSVRDKDLQAAAGFYKKGLEVAPWWPEGRFNRALILAETSDYAGAMTEMKRYLALVPDAPNARAAQDKIYDWERKAASPPAPAEDEQTPVRPSENLKQHKKARF
ncbi:MAG TPA: tetratricopeptide repeat protein [Elusimicrobiota bacterium]|jgi:tetratricopeptide (TPR) repeat protein|nr:tetratricopeptide repeat protein [Elusimicrobiota bacterium]